MDTRNYLEGKSNEGFKFFGNHKKGNKSYIFRLLAPNAENVYIKGDFNNWKSEKLRKYNTGVFSKTIKNSKVNDEYIYIIEDKNGNKIYKLDPYAKIQNKDFSNSIVYDDSYKFSYKYKNKKNLNLYQVNLRYLNEIGVFDDDKSMTKYIEYIKNLNFSHILFMPITSYKDVESLGYSPFSFFSLDVNLDIYKIKRFIDLSHRDGLGVLVEFSLNEFDNSEKSLINFDFSNMYNYDYEDILYNYKRNINLDIGKDIVKSFVKSIIFYWIKEFNLDGVFISNLEDVIFWQGDISRGINEKWLNFLKDLNEEIKNESKISIGNYNSIYNNDINKDLGFSYIFDRSFSNIIKLFQKIPFYRDNYKEMVKKYFERDLNNFILGFNYYDSLSEGCSLLMKMYSEDFKYDQLKTLFTFLYSIESNKIIFMGDEFGSIEKFDLRKLSRIKINKDEEEDFLEFFKDLSYIYNNIFNNFSGKIKDEILEIEGYSLYAIKRLYKKKNYLLLFNFTDLSYNLKSPYFLDTLISTKNNKKSIEKDEIINIKPFESFIFQIYKP
ncbi:1,4-alpha-glucan branching protein [Anaerococcus sp. WCA-380-WT-2B]|uniref:1,4-alpha-glucan branching protein n=1 Tax=Anaerococcus porci TaxID=2652269 RepID=A0A6N7VSK3_9FIRM|nr:1,4-alpha-glucan branching protein [Anaerococcus porci]MSS77043.1 1,4-alpha-glucan branching protein [Anaerococcus porci]